LFPGVATSGTPKLREGRRRKGSCCGHDMIHDGTAAGTAGTDDLDDCSGSHKREGGACCDSRGNGTAHQSTWRAGTQGFSRGRRQQRSLPHQSWYRASEHITKASLVRGRGAEHRHNAGRACLYAGACTRACARVCAHVPVRAWRVRTHMQISLGVRKGLVRTNVRSSKRDGRGETQSDKKS
jgi:hypothetical protein